jgi:hypothetical protein
VRHFKVHLKLEKLQLHRCVMANAGKTVFTQFPKARSIHSGFIKINDDLSKKRPFRLLQLIKNELAEMILDNLVWSSF